MWAVAIQMALFQSDVSRLCLCMSIHLTNATTGVRPDNTADPQPHQISLLSIHHQVQSAFAQVAGLSTNQSFIQRLLTHPSFMEGSLDTAFIPTHLTSLMTVPPLHPQTLALAALAFHHLRIRQQATATVSPASPPDRYVRMRKCRVEQKVQIVGT